VEKQCESDCREDLIEQITTVKNDLLCRINKTLMKTSVRWFVGISIFAAAAVWTGSYAIYADGVKKREKAIESTEKAVTEMRVEAAEVRSDVEHIKKSQERIEKQNTEIMQNLRKIADKLED
jgi:septal ring factor EnvC (AmiA/AmiB activator)